MTASRTHRSRPLALAGALLALAAAAPAAWARTVIVELRGEPAAVVAARAAAAGNPLSEEAIEAYRDRLRGDQDQLLAALAARGIAFTVDRATIGALAGTGVQSVEHRYTLVYNGVALQVDDSAVAALTAVPGVKAVHENVVHRPQLDRSVAYTRADQVYGAAKELTAYDDVRDGFEGQGTKVAVIDTGIEWSHEMFGGDPTPPRHGLLPPTTGANNAKVIYYLPLMENAVDDFGHGTHAASIIAGYLGFAPGADGLPNTADDVRVHGVAPQARLMGYKVCSGAGSASGAFGCLSTSITLAIEDAVSPRTLTGFPKPVADVINLSLGGPGGPDDTSSVAASNAALLGTIVVASAGNEGPGLDTLGSPAAGRHVIAVGANTDPGVFPNSVEVLTALGTPAAGTPEMTAIWAPDSNLRSNIDAPIVGRYVDAGYADTPDQVPLAVAGNICLVERGSTLEVDAADSGTGLFGNKAANCAAKGAVATIVFNDEPGPLEGVLAPSHIPVFTLAREDGLYLRDSLGFDVTGLSRFAIRINPEKEDLFAPAMAGFSSRGPVRGLGQVKPDVTAPGVAVLAATTPVGVPVLSMQDATRYTPANGTSFSGPHVAGAAALLRQAHPAWTPDLVRAALVNYATNLRTAAGAPKADGPAADPILAQGGGLVDVAAAVRAKALMGIVGDGVAAPGLLASYSFGKLPVVDTRVVHREEVTVHLLDVAGEGGTYGLSPADNRALTLPGVSVAVSPETVAVAPGGSASFVVSIAIDGDQLREVPADDLQWYVVARRTDGGASLRMPFYLKPLRSQPRDVLGEQTDVHEGLVLAGDTGGQTAGGVTYSDIEITVTTAFGLAATLDFLTTGDAPDLDLALLDPLGDVIATSANAGGPEHLEALLDGPGTYVYRVIGWANGPTPFTLSSTQRFGGQAPALLPIATEYTPSGGQRVDFDGAFDLRWQPTGGEQWFEIERSTDAGASWSDFATVDGGVSSFTLTGQPQGALAFRLRAIYPGVIGYFVSSPSAAQSVLVDRRVLEAIVVKTTVSNVSFAGGVFQLDLAFTNQTTRTYVPFVDLRVIAVKSASGTVEVIDADNGGDGRSTATAALFDYSEALGGDAQLSPGEKSGTRTLRFADPAAELFTFDVQVTGYRQTGGANGAGAAATAGGRRSRVRSGDGSDDDVPAEAPPSGSPGLRITVNPLTGAITALPL